MIQTKSITPEESMEEQLKDFLLEAGTYYGDSSREAVERFVKHLKVKEVVDLGAGDGASTLPFQSFGVKVTAVDINKDKLKLNPTKVVKSDMITYLKKHKNIPNIFCHHALEHLPNPQGVLDLIGEKLVSGGYVYIEVPSDDTIHSVHHATFDGVNDITPKGLEVVESDSLPHKEHYVIARKP